MTEILIIIDTKYILILLFQLVIFLIPYYFITTTSNLEFEVKKGSFRKNMKHLFGIIKVSLNHRSPFYILCTEVQFMSHSDRKVV